MTPNIADIIRHHVSLEVRCLDRIYLHAYIPKLQTSGGLCYFLHDHLGYRIPSPALFKPLHDRFVTAVDRFVAAHAIPVVHFESGANAKTTSSPRTARGSPPARASSSSALRKRRCGPSKPHKRPAAGGSLTSTSRASRSP